MVRKCVGGIGFVLLILGVGCVDSPSLLVPLAMIASGAVMIWTAAGLENKWTKR